MGFQCVDDFLEAGQGIGHDTQFLSVAHDDFDTVFDIGSHQQTLSFHAGTASQQEQHEADTPGGFSGVGAAALHIGPGERLFPRAGNPEQGCFRKTEREAGIMGGDQREAEREKGDQEKHAGGRRPAVLGDLAGCEQGETEKESGERKTKEVGEHHRGGTGIADVIWSGFAAGKEEVDAWRECQQEEAGAAAGVTKFRSEPGNPGGFDLLEAQPLSGPGIVEVADRV